MDITWTHTHHGNSSSKALFFTGFLIAIVEIWFQACLNLQSALGEKDMIMIIKKNTGDTESLDMEE